MLMGFFNYNKKTSAYKFSFVMCLCFNADILSFHVEDLSIYHQALMNFFLICGNI